MAQQGGPHAEGAREGFSCWLRRISPRFAPELEKEYDSVKDSSREHFSLIMGPCAVVAQVVLGFVLGSGWAASVDRFHRINNCISLAFFVGGLTILPRVFKINSKAYYDWGSLVCCMHFAVYQSMSFGRTANLLSIKGYEQSMNSEAKILLYLTSVMSSMLFAPVDPLVHAGVCFLFPTVFFMEALVFGTAFDAASLVQVGFCLYYIGLVIFMAARRHEVEMREMFLDGRWQRRRVAEISDLLSAVFDACCLIDANSTMVLETNPKLNHLFQQDMRGKFLASFIGTDSDRGRLDAYLRNMQVARGAQVISLRFVCPSGSFEASVIATMFATVESRRQQRDGVLIGIQVSAASSAGAEPQQADEDARLVEEFREESTSQGEAAARPAAGQSPGALPAPPQPLAQTFVVPGIEFDRGSVDGQFDRGSVASFNVSVRTLVFSATSTDSHFDRQKELELLGNSRVATAAPSSATGASIVSLASRTEQPPAERPPIKEQPLPSPPWPAAASEEKESSRPATWAPEPMRRPPLPPRVARACKAAHAVSRAHSTRMLKEHAESNVPHSAEESSDGFSHGRVDSSALTESRLRRRRVAKMWCRSYKETPSRTRLASIIDVMEHWNTRKKHEVQCCALHGTICAAAAAVETLAGWPCQKSWPSGMTWQCQSCLLLNGVDDEDCKFCGTEPLQASEPGAAAPLPGPRRREDG